MVYHKDYTRPKGDSKSWVFNVYSDRAKTTVKDISGYVFKFTLKENKTDSQEDAKIAVTKTVGDGTSGSTILEVTAAAFDLDPGLYYYDIEKKKRREAREKLLRYKMEYT